jgi:Na+-driven multidrug efflux pump
VLLGHALVMALGMGLATAAVIALAPDALLSLYGVAPGSPLNAAARAYLLVRTVSVPSIFLMFVAVGASLGAGNALAPTTGILAAAVVNLIGDGYLVLYCGAGLAGAAAATAAASWTGSLLVLTRLRRLIKPRFRCVVARAQCCVFCARAANTTCALARSLCRSAPVPTAGQRLLTWRRCWRCLGRCC